MKRTSSQQGMTLIEMMVSLAIFTLIMLAVTSFQRNVYTFDAFANNSLSGTQDARTILRTMAKELRSTSAGNNGSYAIITAATSSLSFYSDTDGDGVKEQIRYFLATTTLKRGVIKPTGSPLTYNPSSEVISTLAYNVRNATSTPIFDYYDDTYAGTSSPLVQPVSVVNISLVKISLMMDADPKKAPISILYTSEVTLRNLKDNL